MNKLNVDHSGSSLSIHLLHIIHFVNSARSSGTVQQISVSDRGGEEGLQGHGVGSGAGAGRGGSEKR